MVVLLKHSNLVEKVVVRCPECGGELFVRSTWYPGARTCKACRKVSCSACGGSTLVDFDSLSYYGNRICTVCETVYRWRGYHGS